MGHPTLFPALWGNPGQAVRETSRAKRELRAWAALRAAGNVSRKLIEEGESMRRPKTLVAGSLVLAAALLGACAQAKDATVSGSVKTKLAADSQVNAGEIKVDSVNGVVTLTGNIDSEAAKERALQIARDTKGVTQVKDMISVRESAHSGDAPSPSRTMGERLDDTAITSRVKKSLLDDPAVRGLKIDVDTREGVVYLTGSIPGSAEREKAVQIARATEGVRDVEANFQ